MPVRRYTEISDYLERRIIEGDITHRLPTQRILCKEFGSSNRTVQKAMDKLITMGLIYSIPGVGYYVRKES